MHSLLKIIILKIYSFLLLGFNCFLVHLLHDITNHMLHSRNWIATTRTTSWVKHRLDDHAQQKWLYWGIRYLEASDNQVAILGPVLFSSLVSDQHSQHVCNDTNQGGLLIHPKLRLLSKGTRMGCRKGQTGIWWNSARTNPRKKSPWTRGQRWRLSS